MVRSMEMLKSDAPVAPRPAVASPITLLQSTIPPAVMSARSAGVRATPARSRALYERASRTNVPVAPPVRAVGIAHEDGPADSRPAEPAGTGAAANTHDKARRA